MHSDDEGGDGDVAWGQRSFAALYDLSPCESDGGFLLTDRLQVRHRPLHQLLPPTQTPSRH